VKLLQERSEKVHIAIVTDCAGFPRGMAAASRIRLLAEAFTKSGATVNVLCTRVSERPPMIENKEVSGRYHGIVFDYTTGSTTRADRFLERRYREVRGIVTDLLTLTRQKKTEHLDCIYSYMTTYERSSRLSILLGIGRLLGVPVIADLCERPWTIDERHGGSAGWTPLKSLSGVVAISRFLENWAVEEARRSNNRLRTLYVPILADVHEQEVKPYPTGRLSVVFAGASAYDDTVLFILDAMAEVWKEFPDCRLVITGLKPGDPDSERLTERIRGKNLAGDVSIMGYLLREDLLDLYQSAYALLIPLFDDVRSRARFPTKIGEYLSSGKPVVTTSVGEIQAYLQDGVNAYISVPGDARAYGGKICEVLQNQEKADEVGRSGRTVAERNFHYTTYQVTLNSFVKEVVAGCATKP